MPDLILRQPFYLELSILGSEEVLPSFEVAVKLVIDQLGTTSTYEATSLWIACSQWDSFVENLLDAPFSIAVLEDLGGEFRMAISTTKEGYHFSMQQVNTSPLGKRSTIAYAYTLGLEELSLFREIFEQFPKWW